VEKSGIPGYETLGSLSSLIILTIWYKKRRKYLDR